MSEQVEVEEGGTCPNCGEPGLEYVSDGDCYCHLSAPCHACENAKLACAHCGWRDGDD